MKLVGKRPHETHKDPTTHAFWHPPCLGPWMVFGAPTLLNPRRWESGPLRCDFFLSWPQAQGGLGGGGPKKDQLSLSLASLVRFGILSCSFLGPYRSSAQHPRPDFGDQTRGHLKTCLQDGVGLL